MFDHPKLKLLIEPHEIEQGAVKQIAQVLGINVLEKMVVLPDVHQGYDIPIGSVALIKDHIWPGAVGVDINCGMCHINTERTLEQLDIDKEGKREKFLNEMKKYIPTGFNCHDNPQENFVDFINADGNKELYDRVTKRAEYQLGTLGGGR